VAPTGVDAYPRPVVREQIRLRTTRVNAVLGTSLDRGVIGDALAPLGIDLGDAGDDDGDTLIATPPSFRPDLEREIDLVEEVARRFGFDRIGRTLPDTHGQVGALTERQRSRRLVADALVGAGCSEAITLPLVAPGDLARAGAPTDRVVRAANPLRAEESVLRTRIVPGLLRAAAANRAYGLNDVALFEVGRVFLAPRPGALLPDEPEHLGVVLSGAARRRPLEPDRPVDVYDALDAVRAVADAVGVSDVRIEAVTAAGFAPGTAGRLVAGSSELGIVGVVAADVLDSLGLVAPVVAAEVALDALLMAPRRGRTFHAPSRFPASLIDLAFVLPDSVSAGDVIVTVRGAVEPLEEVRVFDVFRSQALGEGRRSVALSLRFRAPDRTLTDAQVGELRRQCIDAVVRAYGAELRG
jgi:phenylalanyl-tRNA synthetase beta chain